MSHYCWRPSDFLNVWCSVTGLLSGWRQKTAPIVMFSVFLLFTEEDWWSCSLLLYWSSHLCFWIVCVFVSDEISPIGILLIVHVMLQPKLPHFAVFIKICNACCRVSGIFCKDIKYNNVYIGQHFFLICGLSISAVPAVTCSKTVYLHFHSGNKRIRHMTFSTNLHLLARGES